MLTQLVLALCSLTELSQHIDESEYLTPSETLTVHATQLSLFAATSHSALCVSVISAQSQSQTQSAATQTVVLCVRALVLYAQSESWLRNVLSVHADTDALIVASQRTLTTAVALRDASLCLSVCEVLLALHTQAEGNESVRGVLCVVLSQCVVKGLEDAPSLSWLTRPQLERLVDITQTIVGDKVPEWQVSE